MFWLRFWYVREVLVSVPVRALVGVLGHDLVERLPYMIIFPEPWSPYLFWWVFVPSQNQTTTRVRSEPGRKQKLRSCVYQHRTIKHNSGRFCPSNS